MHSRQKLIPSATASLAVPGFMLWKGSVMTSMGITLNKSYWARLTAEKKENCPKGAISLIKDGV